MTESAQEWPPNFGLRARIDTEVVDAVTSSFTNSVIDSKESTQLGAHEKIRRSPAPARRDVLARELSIWASKLGKASSQLFRRLYRIARGTGNRHDAALAWAKSLTSRTFAEIDSNGAITKRWIQAAIEGNPIDRISEWRAPAWIAPPRPSGGLYPELAASEYEARLPLTETDAAVARFQRILRAEFVRAVDRARRSLVIAHAEVIAHADTGIRGRRVVAQHAFKDNRKQAIAAIKKGKPNITALEVCLKMDRQAERNQRLCPPQSWQKLTGKRLWAGCYTDARTRPRVQTYISKIRAA